MSKSVLTSDIYRRYNSFLLEKLSYILNHVPDFITKEFVKDLSQDGKISERDICAAVIARASGLDIDKIPAHHELYKSYFFDTVHLLDSDEYKNNPYLKTVKFPKVRGERWSFGEASYKPYEMFVCDDFRYMSDGRVIPQIGFFDTDFSYPVVYENGREWMTVTPNEINTMKKPVEKAHGRVLTYGLGLGYFAFMASCKEDVSSVTVVEREDEIIKMFSHHILPQLPYGDKIKIEKSDAFEYAERKAPNGNFDFIFTDIWHDPSDGVMLYKKMKQYEHLCPNSEFMYWIYETLKYYM